MGALRGSERVDVGLSIQESVLGSVNMDHSSELGRILGACGSDTADTLGSAMGLFPLERIPGMSQKSYQ